MKRETTWTDILFIILACLAIGVIGAKAQSTLQKDISQSDFLIYLDTMPLHIPIGSKISDSTHLVDYPFAPIKSLEYNRRTTINFLMRLIVDLMEPGETITIKKVKE